MSWVHDLLAGIGGGLIGGLTSGFMGTSPGGGLVISAYCYWAPSNTSPRGHR